MNISQSPSVHVWWIHIACDGAKLSPRNRKASARLCVIRKSWDLVVMQALY